MTDSALPRFEVDGRPATTADLAGPALHAYGHFTAMQVRDRRVKGLDLHLARLDSAHRELFGAGLDGALVRDRVRQALADDTADASVRVHVYPAARGDATSVLVAVRPPKRPRDTDQALLTVPYQRSVPEVKHIGDFGQVYYRRLARTRGFDDALLTGVDGTVSETATANVGFFDEDGTVVWPQAPQLVGITMQLLTAHGPASRTAPVRTADLTSFSGAFLSSSRGVATVSRVDDVPLAVDRERSDALRAVYASVPGDLI